MAIAQGNIFVAPSTDARTLDNLNAVDIESGLYILNASHTILGVTSTKWTVLCMSNEIKDSIHCYSQIWIPGTASIDNVRMFIRTSASDSTEYTNYSELLTEEALARRSVINNDADKVELVLGGVQPTPIEGTKVLWVA